MRTSPSIYHRIGLACRAANQSSDAGEQFRQAKRLDQIVVSSLIEAIDPVRQRVAGRQDQDGCPMRLS